MTTDDKIDIRGYLIPLETLEAELRANGYCIIPLSRLRLATTAGYVARYYELTTTAATYSAAWSQVETEYQQTFHAERFASWDSFRNSPAVQRFFKKKKKLPDKQNIFCSHIPK